MDTVEDLRLLLLAEYNVHPTEYDGETLDYKFIRFRRSKPGYVFNEGGSDNWEVHMHGHTPTFYRTDDLLKKLEAGGSLLYWFHPDSPLVKNG